MTRILVVDDDPATAEMLAEVLTIEGYEVTTATQSLRVFDVAKEFQPDLVLMDLVMPYLDGFDQLHLFSMDETLARVPAIIVTGQRGASDTALFPERLGVVDHVYKPFAIGELLAKVRRALGLRLAERV